MRIAAGFLAYALLSGASVACASQVQHAESLYTDLSGGNCRLEKENKETGATVHRCTGVEGFQLLVADDDSRMSVSVVAPDKMEHPLDFWDVVTPAFSTLGPRAEWRVVKENGKTRPVALIIRVNADEQQAASRRKVSYLAVAKISDKTACVTRKIEPSADANERAREAANAAANERCLKP